MAVQASSVRFGRVGAAWAGARWAHRAKRQAAAGLSDDGLAAAVDPPPTTEPGSLRGARVVLGFERATCLERSFVIQRWWLEYGVPLDVVIGVKSSSSGVKAHAWVDRFDRDQSDEFQVIRRHTAG
ncbi:MAG: lasso peptide biosynthesis B2 protein [Solirubrobacteraceae bacterium]|nr:lasso peptide biosynthesis B2 protein [Solirubrobacteraceae bacterium]